MRALALFVEGVGDGRSWKTLTTWRVLVTEDNSCGGIVYVLWCGDCSCSASEYMTIWDYGLKGGGQQLSCHVTACLVM